MIDAELTLVGALGPVRGRPGRRGGTGFPVLEVRHTLVSPRDASTGLPTGKRRHAPITVVKEVDRATPRLLQAWARNEVLTTWRLDVFGTDEPGRRAAAYSIELRRASVVEVSLVPPEEGTFPREAVAFAYEAITWTWVDGKVTAQDDWAAQT